MMISNTPKLLVHMNQGTGEFDLGGTKSTIKTPFWGRVVGVGERQGLVEGESTTYWVLLLDLFGEGLLIAMNVGVIAFHRFTLATAAALMEGEISPDSDSQSRFVIFDNGYETVSVMGGRKIVKVPIMRMLDRAPASDEKVYPAIPGIRALLKGLLAFPPLEEADDILPEPEPYGEVEVPVEGDEFGEKTTDKGKKK